MESRQPTQANRKNLVIAALTGQVGCLTLIIVLAAVLAGLALDKQFGTKPWITIGLLVGSIPVSIFLMLLIARKAVAKLKMNQEKFSGKEVGIERDS